MGKHNSSVQSFYKSQIQCTKAFNEREENGPKMISLHSCFDREFRKQIYQEENGRLRTNTGSSV